MSLSPTTYDLATAAADFPLWDGPPRRTLLLCSHPRSGSTLLGEDLYASGAFACPLEYFHRGFRPAFAERWQAPLLQTMRSAAHRHRTDATGLFSSKLFWKDIEDIVDELDPALAAQLRECPVGAQAYRRLHALLGDWFPNPSFIHLTRKDRLRQAISALLAIQTQQWRAIPGQGRALPLHAIAYDYQRILALVAAIDYSHAHWAAYFAANGITPLSACYEDLQADGAPALRALFDALGYAGALPARRMQRQAASASEQWLARFLRDHHARLSRSA
jgi:LPS sulfotransferase NodH